VKNATGGEDDKLATAAIADIQVYWADQLPANFGQKFAPVTSLLSYSAMADGEETACGNTKGLVNAFYCPPDDSVAWDRGVLLPMLRQRFGPMSVVTVLAHELGHAIQFRLGDKAGIAKSTPTIVKEQQADCFAGGYFRWVAEGKSKYYQVSTAEGIDEALASMFFIRDQTGASATSKGAHGTAFDRTFAFQAGFEKGPKECAAMNQQNVSARITEQPFAQADTGKGDAKITQYPRRPQGEPGRRVQGRRGAATRDRGPGRHLPGWQEHTPGVVLPGQQHRKHRSAGAGRARATGGPAGGVRRQRRGRHG
jgi:predicted metalloprotease